MLTDFSNNGNAEIQRTNPHSILNKRDDPKISRRKRLSVNQVSDMLFEYYKSNSAKVPKHQEQMEICQYAQVSPTSAATPELSSIAAIATNGASETASKNLLSDEMLKNHNKQAAAATFHPRIKLVTKQQLQQDAQQLQQQTEIMTAIPNKDLFVNTIMEPQQELDIKPIINPVTGLIMQPVAVAPPTAPLTAKPHAAVIAEALLRRGLHNMQQQWRAKDILRHQVTTTQRRMSAGNANAKTNGNGNGDITPNKILENLLRQQKEQNLRTSECENEPEYGSDAEDGFDDIHLVEHATPKFGNSSLPLFNSNTGNYRDVQQLALRNLEYTLSDYGNSSNDSSTSPNGLGNDGESQYECRHCGKKYRWKSTLRRHENVECGGKEPAHQCPYCPYKSKQRGNLGVHVRKHHTDMPQLPSKRRSKYSMHMMSGGMSMSSATSDDSQVIVD